MLARLGGPAPLTHIGGHRPLGEGGVVDLVCASGPILERKAAVVEIVSRENARQSDHVVIGVGFNRVARRVRFYRSVHVELEQTDGKQLHHFARVILVRFAPRIRIALAVAFRVEKEPHGRVERNRFEKVAVIAEGVLVQRVPVMHQRLRAPIVIQRVQSNYEKFGQGESGALADRIFARRQLLPQGVVGQRAAEEVVFLIHFVVALPGEPVRPFQDDGGIHLTAQPILEALALNRGQVRVGDRHSRMQEKARSLRFAQRLLSFREFERIGLVRAAGGECQPGKRHPRFQAMGCKRFLSRNRGGRIRYLRAVDPGPFERVRRHLEILSGPPSR